MENIVSKLVKLGISEYEAKVYLSLLNENPSTAYELGKASGVPTSKIYEVLKRLIEKGIISVIEDGKIRQYVPMALDEFINKYRSGMEDIIASLRTELSNLRTPMGIPYVSSIVEYEYLMDRVQRMIKNASVTILLSVCKEEFEILEDIIRNALKRDAKVAIVHFGSPGRKIGQIYPHPDKYTTYKTKGRGIAVVVDSTEALTGTILKFNIAEGIWSMNKGFVTFVEEYIKHDIYMMKIMRRFDRNLKLEFGLRYEKLRDVFTDD